MRKILDELWPRLEARIRCDRGPLLELLSRRLLPLRTRLAYYGHIHKHKSLQMCVFDLGHSLTLSASEDSHCSGPQLVFSCYGNDLLGHDVVRGYGALPIPTQPGRYGRLDLENHGADVALWVDHGPRSTDLDSTLPNVFKHRKSFVRTSTALAPEHLHLFSHIRVVPCFVPQASSSYQRIIGLLSGRRPEFIDPSLVARPEARHGWCIFRLGHQNSAP